MQRPSARAAVLSIALGSMLLLTGASVFASSTVRVKYALQDLDDSEREQLLSLVDQLAQVEAIVAICDQPQRYDARLQEKVRSCIEGDSINAMQRFFEQRFDFYVRSVNRATCENPELRTKLPEVKKAMDSALAWIGLMCSFCLFC